MNLFQSPEWEQLKLQTGYAKSYRLDDVLILQKKLPLGFSMLYSPMIDQVQSSKFQVQGFNEQIKKIVRGCNAIFYRAEIDIPVIPNTKYDIPAFGFTKSFEEMQPEHTLILDLSKREEEILAQMKQKGRYNIKIANKSNLVIKKTTTPDDSLDDFYRLYSATGKRHGITFRSKKYFESLLDILGRKGYAELETIYLVQGIDNDEKIEKIALASAIIVYSGKKAIYLYGASSDEHKNLMAPYKLHFNIIKDAKARGCTEYDFFGIAPDDSSSHPWAGVTRFKKQFGGTEQQIAGSYDLVFKPFMYKLFKIAEKIRRK
ncbi:hypothetical protein COT78_03680 [Candidatus Berkelbacteria bacterium CG10_big_fil_rev_8_21_14_0_10_43_13]|uniref:Peptidoglycan bridge formation protein FemAB n=1 Tax=Candidatus Berkelbacteria bacterium CG10_big_fil_rev_8_21_14_0_10_43_13 TaxID=1974514 RepID=A0A2H0W5R9_9BACT|nr:MAG: hypothetical protein COT78_03680 [Candidatus Berkelbacteria bacterium CG10_big_fil_rev_8_21_14_0_10_43_13]